jgi:hypothetical protein
MAGCELIAWATEGADTGALDQPRLGLTSSAPL